MAVSVPQDHRHEVSRVDEISDTRTNRTYTTAEDETVPAGMYRVYITADAASWINFGATAAAPTADTGNSLYLPAGIRRGFRVTPAQTISCLSVSGTAHACFEYFTS